MNKSSESPTKPILSLCMIVKNERENLPRCLASVKPYVDEIIVVDTGSEDGTPEIAANYGAKVSYFKWCDDFAAARNYVISQASGNWILMMDADEELVVESEDFFKELNAPSEILAYNLNYREINDYLKRIPTYRPSLFRNIPRLRYVRRLHEYLADNEQFINSAHISYASGLEIVHYGYFKEQVRHKIINRNLPILESMAQEEELTIDLLKYLAEMYVEVGQVEKAKEWYAKAFEHLLPNLLNGNPPENYSTIPSLIYNLGMQFFQQKDYETTSLLCKQGLQWFPNYPPLNYLGGILLNTLGFPLGAASYFKTCLQLGQENNYYKRTPFDLIFITTYPAYNLGLMYLKLGRIQEALDAFERTLSFDANFNVARAQVDRIKQLLKLDIPI